MWKELVKHSIGIALALTIGLVTWYMLEIEPAGEPAATAAAAKPIERNPLPGLISVLIGTLAEVAWLVILDLRETKQGEEAARGRSQKMGEKLESMEHKSSELVEILRQRIERDEPLNELMRFQKLGLTRADLTENWIYLLTRLRRSYRATNYIKDIYTTEWANAALLIQNGKKKADPQMQMCKVFLVDDEREILSLSEHIEQQLAIGIDVYDVPYSVVTSDADLAQPLQSGDIPSIDFGIFDERFVLVWQLKNRQIDGGVMLHSGRDVELHRAFFDKLFRKAAAYSRDRFLVIAIPDEALNRLIQMVAAWPAYDEPYRNMDYALRPTKNGWLTHFARQAGSRVFAAFYRGTLVGFSLLIGGQQNDKELYVAVHPRHVNQKERKIGSRLAHETVRLGFQTLQLDRVHLKVRPQPEYRVAVYERLGFQKTGSPITESVNDEATEFYPMAMQRKDFV